MKKIAWMLSVAFFICACGSPSPSPQLESSQQHTEFDNAFPAFTGAYTRLIGRFDAAQPGRASFTWPGSAVEFIFNGRAASMALASTGDVRFEVDVDGETHDLWVKKGEAIYALAENLSPGEHRVRLTRLTESFQLVTALISDPMVDGTLLPAPLAPDRQLLLLGDSISAGYGVEGANEKCGYSADTSNQQLTYAALAADALGADLHSIAWSGIGAWRSYGEKSPINPSIAVRAQRTLADDANSRWNKNNFEPDAILIAIGTNDYWDGAASDEYRKAMQKLVAQVTTDYPQRPIYLLVSPMLQGEARQAQKAVLNSLKDKQTKVLDLGRIEPEEGYGCDYHPNVTTNRKMATALQQNLAEDLAWR